MSTADLETCIKRERTQNRAFTYSHKTCQCTHRHTYSCTCVLILLYQWPCRYLRSDMVRHHSMSLSHTHISDYPSTRRSLPTRCHNSLIYSLHKLHGQQDCLVLSVSVVWTELATSQDCFSSPRYIGDWTVLSSPVCGVNVFANNS